MTSSMVTAPINRRRRVAHGHRHHVVGRESSGHVDLLDLRVDELGPVGDAVAEMAGRLLAEQALDADGTEEPSGGDRQRRVRHEHLRGQGHRQLLDPEQRERLGDRGGGRHDHRLGRHQTTGRRRLVGEQPTDRGGLVRFHGLEQAGPLLGRQLAEEVGGVVGVHGLEDVGGPFEVEALDDADLLVLGQLLEQVGESLVLHDLGQTLTLQQREGADAVRDVGRVASRGGGRPPGPRRRPRTGGRHRSTARCSGCADGRAGRARREPAW